MKHYAQIQDKKIKQTASGFSEPPFVDAVEVFDYDIIINHNRYIYENSEFKKLGDLIIDLETQVILGEPVNLSINAEMGDGNLATIFIDFENIYSDTLPLNKTLQFENVGIYKFEVYSVEHGYWRGEVEVVE